ncbi:amino acid ABC transporter permease [Labedella phragmitis]|uniref:Amino acid ABC transporter permease n=2 Tax=Labedella TaxID=390250 RepID=A0A3S3ZVT5_9MICO|nr:MULTISPECIES: amino acid ABC transporter permease [Labedella]RWZ46057.1 amino acid ABC transporter permease [Labedella phragmitis]RWZ54827.1 amino acid ABC transporter permease [Labedella populi]
MSSFLPTTPAPLSWLWDWYQWIPTLLPGLGTALLLTLVSVGVGYPLGFGLALLTETRSALARWFAIVVVEVGRGLPILVLLLLVYRGLPSVGILFDAFLSASVALVWSSAAYSAEIIRTGLGAVPRGQFDAAYALSMNRTDMYRLIVLPQALRVSIPPLVNLGITMFHATSLATVITVEEIMHIANLEGSIYFRYMSVFMAAAVIYLAITVPVSLYADRLAKRLGGVMTVRKTVLRRPAGSVPVSAES